MSDPILSPHGVDAAEGTGRSPISLLARGYPPSAAVSVVMLLVTGGWLLTSPLVLAYSNLPQARSDWASASTILILALAALAGLRPWLCWIAGTVGLWVLLAPTVLQSDTIAQHLNGLITGTLIATFGLVFPLGRVLPGPEVPEGWSYNPAGWSQRAPVIVLAALGFAFAAYMAAFQLGFIDAIWDPISGDGSMRVLTSELADWLPGPDAALCAAMFLVALLMACAGDPRRWRTLPWLVFSFGLLVVPMAVVAVVRAIHHPLVVGAWCGWCLVATLATIAMISLALDEITATFQLLRRVRRAGHSWWRTLWRGAPGAPSP